MPICLLMYKLGAIWSETKKNARWVKCSVNAARSRRLNLRERQQQILQIISFPSWEGDLVSIQYTQAPGSERMKRDNQHLHWWNRVVYTEWNTDLRRRKVWWALEDYWEIWFLISVQTRKGCGKHFDTCNVSKNKTKQKNPKPTNKNKQTKPTLYLSLHYAFGLSLNSLRLGKNSDWIDTTLGDVLALVVGFCLRKE